MYNNFSSKKTKKVISALLASALVVTSAPITADAATSKVLGVKKTFTVAGTKVTGLSKAEKKVVKVTIKNKKVTVKGLKAGKVSFKIGKKAYNVKVGATKVTATAEATTLKVNDTTTVAIKATNGAKDKLTVKSSQSAVVKVSKTSVTADKNGKASVTLTGLAAGTSTITVKSANTGKYAKVKITVKADETATTAPASDAPATLAPATDAPVGPTAVPTSGGAVTTAPTSGGAVTAAPTATPATGSAIATASAVTASAINTKTIAVVFDRALTKEEQKAIKVDVTREKATQSIKTVFHDDKTLYITRDSESAFAAADYSVTVSTGIVKTIIVKIENQVATKLSIDSKVLVDGEAAATVNVTLNDQYGDTMNYASGDFSVVMRNVTQQKTLSPDVTVASNKVTINTNTNPADYVKDDIIQLTLLHKSGVSVTSNLTVVNATYVNDVEFGEVVLPTGVKRLTQNVTNVKVYYTAKDNYGDIVELAASDDKHTLISTNTDVITAPFTYGKDAKGTYITIPSFAAVGKTSLVLMANGSGKSVQLELNVLENAGDVYEAAYGLTSVNVAKGSKAYVKVDFADKYGDVVAAKNVTAGSDILLNSSDSNLTLSLIQTEGDTHYGYIEIDATSGSLTANSTAIVTATVNGKPQVITVKIGAAAVPTSMTAKEASSSVIIGSSSEVTLVVADQYAGTVDKTSIKAKTGVDAAGQYYIIAAGVGGNVLTKVSVGDYDSVKGVITVTGLVAGTEDVKFTLYKSANTQADPATDEVIDTKTITFTTETNTANNLTYAVSAIPTLYKNNDTANAAASNSYAKAIKLTGTTSTGTVIEIPHSKILSVTSDSTYVVASKDGGTWYVAGRDGDGSSVEKIKADVTANLTVVVATDEGSTIVKTTATVSKDALEPKSIKMYKDGSEISSLDATLGNSGYTITTAGVSFKLVDQFGVETAITEADAVSLSSFTGINGYSDTTASYADSALTVTKGEAEDALSGAVASFKATLVKGALTKTFTVNVTAAP